MQAVSEETRAADRLWSEYARTHDPHTREALVKQFERLAFSIANRYARRGAENEDLLQVAMLGLVKAVDRFDPATRYRFSTFATPTILGEIRRYFRDQAWKLHVPRSMQELYRKVEVTEREIAESTGTAPSPEAVADRLHVPEEQVVEVMTLAQINHPLSLDGEFSKDGDGRTEQLESVLGTEDAHLDGIEWHVGLEQVLDHLSKPLRGVIELRYLKDLTQRETADRMGLTQMQVCRLERRALQYLRVHLDA
jgi:RNA polymerase sigma-B factor